MKIRNRVKIQPIHVRPGDTVILSFDNHRGIPVAILEEKVGREITITEVCIFDVEKGDFEGNVVDGIGVSLLSVEQ